MPRRHLIHHHLKFYFQKLALVFKLLKSKYNLLPFYKQVLTVVSVFLIITALPLLRNQISGPRFQKANLFSGWDYQSFNPSSDFTVSTKTTPQTGVIDFKYHNSSVEFELPLPGSTIKQSDQDKIEFTTSQNNILPQYQILANGLKENIIINKIPTTNQFQSTLKVTNADIYTNNENLPVFLDPKTKQYLFHVQKPYAFDAKGNKTFAVSYQLSNVPAKKPSHSIPLISALTKANSSATYTLTLKVDSSWLFDPKRAYPITIDPTVIHNKQSDFATGTLNSGVYNRLQDTGATNNFPNIETFYQELPTDQYTTGLWHLNESAGTTAADTSGNGYTGAFTGTSAVTGILGIGRSFNGTSDNITTGIGITAFYTPTDGTIEVWIKPVGVMTTVATASYTGQGIVGSTDGNSGLYRSSINGVGDYLWAYNWDGSEKRVGVAYNANEWTHLAWVHTGGVLYLYKNGTLVGSTPSGNTGFGANYFLGIGHPYASSQFFNGIIDEVRVSKIARPAEQIRADAQRRPYGVYTSPVIDLGDTFASWTSLSWTGPGSATGDGEVLSSGSSLVAQWNFNESAGTTTSIPAGSCGVGCTGVLTNFANTSGQDVGITSGWTANNRRWGSGALMFDGVNDYVTVGSNSSLSPTNLSIESWVNYLSIGSSEEEIIGKWGSGGITTNSYALGVNTTGRLFVKIVNSVPTEVGITDSAIFPQGVWTHVAVTYDGSTINLYKNGIKVASAPQTGNINSTASSLYIGGIAYTSLLQWKGIIDSTRLYSRALTASEILSNYNAGNVEFQTRTSFDGVNWEAWKGAIGDSQLDSLDTTDQQIASDQNPNSSSTVQQPITNSTSVNTGTGADGACTVNSTTNLAAQSCSGRSTPDAVAFSVSGLNGNVATINTSLGLSPSSPGKSCYSLHLSGLNTDGIYWIDPDGPGGADPVQAYCDMTRDGGGWTLVVKDWYLSDPLKPSSAYGSVYTANTLGTTATPRVNGYKLDDNLVRSFIGPSQNFDVMGDQVGQNAYQSLGNFEYVLIRNYTGYWRWDKTVAASTSTTQFESHRLSDGALAWTGNLQCGSWGDAGINCYTVLSGSVPGGGSGCTINMGSATSAAWHHFYMHGGDSDTYLYICNGEQYSSNVTMNHRWWIRERNAVADTAPRLGLASGDEVLITNQQGSSLNSNTVGKYEFLTINSVSAVTKDGSTSNLAGRTCKSLKNSGQNTSGTYWIDPDGPNGDSPFQVYCDMTTDGGGWTRVVTQIAGDVGTTNTDQKWRTALQVTKNWGPGGDIMTTYFNTPAIRPSATPISITKINPGPYGTINNMYRFTNTANSWAYDTSLLFNLRTIYGTNYGNQVWWDYGADLTQKANIQIGSNPNSQVAFSQGSVRAQPGTIYHDGSWISTSVAFEQYVREADNFSDQTTNITFTNNIKNNYGLQINSDPTGRNQKVSLQRVPNYTTVTVAQTPAIGSSISNPGKSCSSLRLDGINADGIYWINPDNGVPFQTYCDMTTDGGGWSLVANIAPADGNSVGYLNQDFWVRQNEYGSLANRFSNDYKNPAAYRTPGNYLMIQSVSTGSNGSILGWRRWLMDSVYTNYKTFNSFFVGGTNINVHATDACETGNSDNVYYGSTSNSDDIIRQGNCLYADINPNAVNSPDLIRLTTIPYNSVNNGMAGFASCINCGTDYNPSNPWMGLDRAGCNAASCDYTAICRDALTSPSADCLGDYCTSGTYPTTLCSLTWNSRFYVKDSFATPDAVLTTSAWNGQTGGILAFRATGTVTNNGTISMDGKGYRGGDIGLPAMINYDFGTAGERAGGVSYQTETSTSAYSGGGGGAGKGGDGGGAGGGFGADGIGATNYLAGSDGGRGGLHFGLNTVDNLLLGGGGGSAGIHNTQRIGMPGGNGGGDIFIASNSLVNNSYITNDGNQGGNGTHSPFYGNSAGAGGGGGAGGNIILQLNNFSSANQLTATGGPGGVPAPGDAGAPGAKGAPGRVVVTSPNFLNVNSIPQSYFQKITPNFHQEGSNALRLNAGYPTTDSATIGLYHFDETKSGTGSTLYDYSGNGIYGIATGTTLVEGIFGKARSFNGNGDAVSLGVNPKFNFGNNGPFTLSGWIKPNILVDYSSFISKDAPGRNSPYAFMSVIMANGRLSLYNSSTWIDICPAGSVSIGKWQHIAFSYNGITATGYVNGVYCGSAIFNYTDNSTYEVDIGSWYSPSKIYDFNGSIDEVRISNTPRSAEEIAEDYRMGAGHRFAKTISTTNLSQNSKLPFWVASNRLGSNLELSIGNSGFTANEPDTNTVALWHLEEPSGSGAYLKDSSLNANHSTPTGTTFAEGKIGKARNFNGTSDYLSIPDNTTLNPSTNITLSAWIKTNVGGDVISKRPAANNSGYLLGIGSSSATMYVYSNGTWQNATCANCVSFTNWNHVVGTFDGSTIKIYVNGRLTGTTSYSGSINTTTAAVVVGRSDAGGNYFTGLIDEPRIDKVTRSADDIRTAYDYGSRTHQVVVDFKAKPDSSGIAANSLSFNLDETPYGASSKLPHLLSGDKLIVQENIGGTEYLVQGAVSTANSSTGAVTMSSWDVGSSFPAGGFTTNATAFKWQQEYFDLKGSLSTQRSNINRLTLRITDGSMGGSYWLDDFRTVTNFMNNAIGSTLLSTPNRFFQYRAIESTSDSNVSTSIQGVSLNYLTNYTPNTPTLTSPANNTTNQKITVPLKTFTTDLENNSLLYKITVCTNAAMTTGCQIFDQNASQVGWSGQNTTIGATSAYTPGTVAAFIPTSQLSSGTVYYWQSQAIDPSGSNLWSSPQSTPWSFTTSYAPSIPNNVPINPNQLPKVSFSLSAIDADSDYLLYQITLCKDMAMSIGCTTFDQTSTQIGWSGQDAGIGNTSAFASGTLATYSIQTTLALNSTYYWKSAAIDPLGTNTWGPTQSSPSSFTTTPKIPYVYNGCLIEEANHHDYLRVKWTGDNNTNIGGYVIQRSVGTTASGASMGAFGIGTTLGVGSSSYTDSTITQGFRYQYRVAPYYVGPVFGSWCTTSTLSPSLGSVKLDI